MKGMKTTLILNEPDNQQPEVLKSIFQDSCLKHGVPESAKEAVINSGMALFEVSSSGNVFPLSKDYPTIASYVTRHYDESTEPADSTEITKEQLYNRLVNYAEAGNMKMYRMARQQYASCSA